MNSRISIAILALGGQGGGVLADWLVELAEHEGWYAQATSVPGVAQRTGATIYYVEIFPRVEQDAREPVLALMPVSGDVDVVVAAELMEAGRAMQRGLVTPDRTTLIASTQRAYAVAEKIALGDGIADPAQVHTSARELAKRYIAFDMAAIAEQTGSVISAALLGAVAGAQVLPFAREQFEQAIRRAGVGVEASLRAFAQAFQHAQGEQPAVSDVHPQAVAEPSSAADPALNALLQQARHEFPTEALAFTSEGLRRLAEYMDSDYAADYLRRLRSVREVDGMHGGAAQGWRLTRECARYLALWMAYEDTIRVADLKTRASRFARVRSEVRAQADQIIELTEYMHPRVEEVADTLPAAWGERLLRSKRVSAWVTRLIAKPRFVRTDSLRGFLLLYLLGGLRGYRRKTLRYRREIAAIETWLQRITRVAKQDYALACEIAESPRLIKGYSDTYARGWANFSTIVAAADKLLGRPDAAQQVRALRDAALADEEGKALRERLQQLV